MPNILSSMKQQTLPKTTPALSASSIQIRRAEAVVNIAGGSVEPGAAEKLEALVSDFGIEVRVTSAEPKTIDNFFPSHDRLHRSDRGRSESSNPFKLVEATH